MAKLTVGLSMIEYPLFLVDYGYNIIKKMGLRIPF